MSVGLLRVLVQKKLVPQENLAKYQEAIKKEKPILPLVFSDKIITPDALAQLCSDVFNYPMLDLNFFPRSRIVPDVLTEEQMQELRCIPLHKRGKKLYVAVSDPTNLQNIQKAVFSTGLSADLVVVRDDQLSTVLEWFGQSNTALLKEMGMDVQKEESAQTMIVDGEEEEDGPVARFIQKNSA